MSLDPALRERIESLLGANRVVLFMKGQPAMPQCGFSAKAVGVLQDLGVDFAHVNVLADAEIREGIKAYGDWPTIPQLYVDGELVGGSDIMLQMANSGELSALLGVAPPDRTPPSITITPAAVEMLKGALADAPGAALQLSIDARFQPNFQLAPLDANAIAAESNGLRVQFDAASARRANGITIDWVDDIRGQGLAIDNPNAPRPVQELDVRSADDQLRAGSLTLVDVRPADERAIAAIPGAVPIHLDLFRSGAAFRELPRDRRILIHCKVGGRSAEATRLALRAGYTDVANVEGGIIAWIEQIDPTQTPY